VTAGHARGGGKGWLTGLILGNSSVSAEAS
jgi:hypothetical protein